MKKLIAFIAVLVLGCLPLAGLTGCGDKDGNAFRISVSASAGGSLTAGAEKVRLGESVTFTITPSDGYLLAEFTINGGSMDVTDGSYTIPYVLSDIRAEATFVQTDFTVKFDAGDTEVAPQSYVYGEIFGSLPQPIAVGKRFVGWTDADGNAVTVADTVQASHSVLTAVWSDITDAEKAALKPFSVTTAYHDMAATKYGVVWHTEIAPVTPVVQYVEGAPENAENIFENAVVVAGESRKWLTEYTINAVLENLKYDTQYTVRMGDLSADVWSDTYTFTTRAEQPEEVKFFYVTDTQETYRIENAGSDYNIGNVYDYIGDTYWAMTMKDAVTRFPDADFIAHGGDIVNYGAEPLYWREMLDSVDEYLFDLPILPVAGNHADAGWYSAGYETFSRLFNIQFSDPETAKNGLYYSLDYGPMHFIALRSNDALSAGVNGKIGQKQINWLYADVATARRNPEIKWIVVMMHEGPMYLSGETYGPNNHQAQLRPQLMPIFDELDIDLVLYGHNHYYNSSYPLKWDAEVKGNGSSLRDGISIVTNETIDFMLDNGDIVEQFVWTGNERGTVLHQTGTAGPQVDSGFSYTDQQDALDAWTYYRAIFSGAKGCIEPDKAFTMYSYIEVTADTLTLRSYGVDAVAQASQMSLDNGRYLDGFQLVR